MTNPFSNDGDEPVFLLNVACLAAPNLLFLGFQLGIPPALTGFSIIGYWLVIPISLLVLLFSRTKRWKVAARRALLGWALTFLIIPFLPL